MVLAYLFMFCIAALISYLWVGGIDYMHTNHKDYRGEDFLDWVDSNKKIDNEQ